MGLLRHWRAGQGVDVGGGELGTLDLYASSRGLLAVPGTLN